MRRKRLKHCAYILCHMFCGWQLYADLDVLAHYGAGKLEIDILNEKCQHNGMSITTLAIAKKIKHWLMDDLAANHIAIEGLKSVTLQVEVVPRFSTFIDGVGIITDVDLYCTGHILTDDAEYNAVHHGKYNWQTRPEDGLRKNFLARAVFYLKEKLRIMN